jgi:phosphatidylserine decarboxylase
VTWLESDAFGHLALIEIGALGVGSIVQTYRPGRVERGAEKGFFHFGGSTVVALVAAGRLTLDDDLVRASAHDIETFVTMGVSVGTAQ